jgi:hypothetical protein
MDEPLIRRYYATHADLCEDSAITTLAEAQAGKQQAALIAEAAHKASEVAHDKLATMHRGAAGLSEQVSALRALDTAKFTEYAMRAVSDEAVSHEDESKQQTERKALLSSLTGALEFYNSSILPRERLAALVLDSRLFAAAAQLSSYVCLEAGIIRFTASKPLVEADGSVGFGEHGQAYELFVSQLNCHRKAADAEALIVAEENRQRALAQGRL